MITKSDIVYFFAMIFNKISDFIKCVLEYLEGLTRRVNKVLLNDDGWIIANDFYMNSSLIHEDIEGYVYKNNTFRYTQAVSEPVKEHGFEWIGMEFSYRKDDAVTTFDLTDWLAKQRIIGTEKEPSPKEILIAWAIATNKLPVLCYTKINPGSAVIKLTNMEGDDVEVLWRGEGIDKGGVDASMSASGIMIHVEGWGGTEAADSRKEEVVEADASEDEDTSLISTNSSTGASNQAWLDGSPSENTFYEGPSRKNKEA